MIVQKSLQINISWFKLKEKNIEADPKAIPWIELIRHLKNIEGTNDDGIQNTLILKILEKIKETRLKLFQGHLTVL